MKIFLLPGNDIANKDWIERVKPVFSQFADETEIHYYDHWKKETSAINLNKETGLFFDKLEDTSGSFGVFAKSAGVLIALEALADCEERPAFAIFAGFPLRFAEGHEYDLPDLLATVDYPVLFIQNAFDPAGSAEELRRLTTRLENIDFLLLQGSSHDYPILGNTQSAIEDFIDEYR